MSDDVPVGDGVARIRMARENLAKMSKADKLRILFESGGITEEQYERAMKSVENEPKYTRPVDYNGSSIVAPDDRNGRTLEIGEQVRRLSGGKWGKIVDRCEGNYVFYYLVDFGRGIAERCKTNEIEPKPTLSDRERKYVETIRKLMKVDNHGHYCPWCEKETYWVNPEPHANDCPYVYGKEIMEELGEEP